MVTRLIAGRKREAIVLAAALFVAIFIVRTTVGSLADAISFLYVAPVILAAITLGARGGALAGAVAVALSTASALIADQPTSAFGYFNRATVFIFIGALAGRFAEDPRSLEAESTRFFDLSRDMIRVAGFDGYFKRVNPASSERSATASANVGRDEGGLVARLGGDEFALLLPETDAAGAEAVGQRLVAALATEELAAAADRAMYVVKAAGGGGASLAARAACAPAEPPPSIESCP